MNDDDMGIFESFGQLYILDFPINYEFYTKIIDKFCNLSIIFTNNNININYNNNSNNNNSNNIYKLNKELSTFILRTYIIKNLYKITPDGGICTYMAPVNIILDSYDRNYTSIINKECIENIISILNHPHFKDCKNIDDIIDKYKIIKNLNLRFI